MEKDKVKHLNRKVAITVAVISTFMAVSKVKDDNIVQAMMQAKSDAVDTWSEYQATRTKHHLAEYALDQSEALKVLIPKKEEAWTRLKDAEDRNRKSIKKYTSEEGELKAKAEGLEARYDQLNFRDDQFDLSDACLSISLMLLAIAALTAEEWLLWLSWTFSALGMISGISGFAGWAVHPDFIVRLLS